MVKAFMDFLFGLFFGMGFMVAYALLKFIVSLLGHAGMPPTIGP